MGGKPKISLLSSVAERNTLDQEYTALKSKLEVALSKISDAQDMLAQYKADVEIAEARL